MAFPEILPSVAVMDEVPAARPVAMPLLLIVEMDESDEFQMTCVVISLVVPSEYVPMALNCCAAPTGMLGFVGVTDMPVKVIEEGLLLPPPPQPRIKDINPKKKIAENKLNSLLAFNTSTPN
jgi:hypothetical protein